MHALYISVSRKNEHILFLLVTLRIADVVTEFIEGLVVTYPGLQYLDGLPEVIKSLLLFVFSISFQWMCEKAQLILMNSQVKVVLRADVSAAIYDKVAVISGMSFLFQNLTFI